MHNEVDSNFLARLIINHALDIIFKELHYDMTTSQEYYI